MLQGSYKQGRRLQDYLTTFGDLDSLPWAGLKQDFFASLKDLDMLPQAGLKQNRVVRLCEAHNSFYFRLELTNASI